MTSVAQTDERITRRKKNRAPAMSLTSLDLKGELPPFFTFVVEDRLAACGDFDPDKVADQLKNLAGRRVGGVISLTEGCSCATALEAPLFESSIELLHLPTEDLTPPTLSDLQRGVEFISRLNTENKAVVVHCAKGIGRTGTMLGAYFIIIERLSAFAAIQHVRDRRPGSIHKKNQEAILYDLEELVLGRCSRPAEF